MRKKHKGECGARELASMHNANHPRSAKPTAPPTRYKQDKKNGAAFVACTKQNQLFELLSVAECLPDHFANHAVHMERSIIHNRL